MNWLSLSILAAASKAANQAVTKGLLKFYGVIEISAYGQLAAAAIVIPFFFVPDAVTIPRPAPFHCAAWVTISLNVAAIILLIDAIRRSDLSYVIPFLALTPVFTILTGRIIRGEAIPAVGIAGITLVAMGAVGIDAGSLRDWITLGGKRIFRYSGVWLVVIVFVIYAVTSVYDKTATLLSDPMTFVFYSTVCRAVLLLFIFLLWRRKSGLQKEERPGRVYKTIVLAFFLVGLIFVLEGVFQMMALQSGMVAYVIAVKRLSILITSIIGSVFFAEKFTWFRIFGAFIMVIGSILIYAAANMAV